MGESKSPHMEPCIHAEPQAASQLHGVCVFCYRDRLGAAMVQLQAAKGLLGQAYAVIFADKSNGDVRVRGRWMERDHFLAEIRAALSTPPAPERPTATTLPCEHGNNFATCPKCIRAWNDAQESENDAAECRILAANKSDRRAGRDLADKIERWKRFVDAWTRWGVNSYVCTDTTTRENLRALYESFALPEVDCVESWAVDKLYDAMIDAREALAAPAPTDGKDQ